MYSVIFIDTSRLVDTSRMTNLQRLEAYEDRRVNYYLQEINNAETDEERDKMRREMIGWEDKFEEFTAKFKLSEEIA